MVLKIIYIKTLGCNRAYFEIKEHVQIEERLKNQQVIYPKELE